MKFYGTKMNAMSDLLHTLQLGQKTQHILRLIKSKMCSSCSSLLALYSFNSQLHQLPITSRVGVVNTFLTPITLRRSPGIYDLSDCQTGKEGSQLS